MRTSFNDAYYIDAVNYANSISVPWTGTIYFETGTSGPYTIDGSDFITTTGGIPSMFTIMSFSGGDSSNTVLNGTVTINNMNAVTLQGFSVSAADPGAGIIVGNTSPISGTLTLTDIVVTNTVGSGVAIIQNNGNVILNNVHADSNFGTGAAVTNTTGSGNATVDSSTFNTNGGDGLRIDHSTVTTTVTVSNSVFGDTTGNIFGVGLKVESKGAITLTNVTANYNLTGVNIDNTFGAGNVTITGTNVFSNNNSGSTGLHVVSNSAISVSGVTANSNLNSDGAYLQSTGGNITVGLSTFNGNDIKGLHAKTIGSGNITLTDVNANSNGYSPYAGGDGLRIEANGIVTVDGVTANSNKVNGATIDNSTVTATVMVSNSTFGDTLGTGNVSKGLDIVSNSDVMLTSVTANYNSTAGVYIYNNTGTGIVTITGTNVFNYNGDSGGTETGLHIVSNGAISVSGVTANSDVSGSGAIIDNATGPVTATVTVTNSSFSGNSNIGLFVAGGGDVTLNNVSAITNITGNGLTITSAANISLTDVTATTNTAGKGADLQSAGGNITVDPSAFSNNGSIGLYAQTNGSGNITLTDVSVNGNSGAYGAYLTNATGGSTGSITLNGTNTFNNNSGGDGLHIEANGVVTVGGVTANNNGGYGAYVDNIVGPAPVMVTINNSAFGTTFGTGNGSIGLGVSSQGGVTLTSVTANYNSTSGTYINNTYGTGNVTMNGTNYFNNNTTGKGLEIVSNGDVTLINVTASYNGLDGANITSNGGIVFIDPSMFEGNGGRGLSINSGAGNITLDCVTSTGNGSPDVVTTSGTVTVSCGAPSQTIIIIIVGDSPSDGGGGSTIIVDTLTDFAMFKSPDGISFFSYGVGGVGNFLIFVPDSIWKNAKPGEVIVNCLDSRGYNLRFSRLTDDRIALFGLGNTAPNEGWYLLRWFAPDGRLVNRVYVRLTFG